MKAFLVSLLLLVPIAPSMNAQSELKSSIQTPISPALSWAWFGWVGGGVSAHDNGPFSRRLRSYTPVGTDGENMLYQTEHFSSIGLNLVAGGGVLFNEVYMIGASGERVSFPTVEAITSPGRPRDQYSLTGGGGGLDLGYAIVNEDATLIYPFIHAGLYGYSLEYRNNQSDSIPFFEGNPVPPGTTATYNGSAIRLGAGIGLVKFLGDGTGGLLVGARLTYGHMPSRPEWEDNGTVVNNGGLTPCYNAVMFSLSVGGGGGGR
jgi:hypothetical protein